MPLRPKTAERRDVILEKLLGEDDVVCLTETITMRRGNRVERGPRPDTTPSRTALSLSDYVTIDEATKFRVDKTGNPVIFFPAGTVTDETNGEQGLRVSKQ